MGPDRHLCILQMGAGTPIAAGTDQEVAWVCPFPGKWKIKNVYLVADDAVGADDTDYTTLTFGDGSTNIFSRATTTAGGALTAKTAEVQDANPSGAIAVVEQGEELVFGKADTGTTGVAFSGSVIWEIVQI